MSQPMTGTTPGRHPEAPLRSPPGGDSEVGVTSKKDVTWVKQKAVVLGLRASACLFSLLCFILMVTISDFTSYSALSYVFTITLVVMVYSAVMVGITGHEIRTRKRVMSLAVAAWLELLGDVILSIMLISAASASAEAVTAIRQTVYGSAVDQITGAVAVSFLAYISLQPAALISTYNFSLYISSKS